MAEPACLIVCSGKDCRNSKGYSALIHVAQRTEQAMTAPCQGLCHGPIVGIRDAGGIRWFSRVRGLKMRQAVVDAAASGRLRKRLRAEEIGKRRNVIRGSSRLRPLTAHGAQATLRNSAAR